MRKSEQRYRELYDEVPVGYHEIDQDARIVNINRTACELLGYRSEELLGKSVLEIIAPAEREAPARASKRSWPVAGPWLLISRSW